MRRYRYQAINENRESVSGHLDAESREAAIAHLESTGLQHVSIEGEADFSFDPSVYEAVESAANEEKTETVRQSAPIQLKERDVRSFGDTLSNLTAAGLPLESGLRALAEEIPSQRTAAALREISERLDRGESLDAVMTGQSAPDVSQPLASLLRSGMGTRELSHVFACYLKYSRQAAELRRKIWSSLIYSIVLLSLLVVMAVLFLVLLMPQFIEIFDGFDTELPSLTLLIVDFSDFLRANGDYLLLSIGLLALALVILTRVFPTKTWRTRMLYTLPLVGETCRNVSVSTFCYLFAALVEARVPLPVALRVAGAGSRDPLLEHSCDAIARDLDLGVPLLQSARFQLSIPPRVLHLFRYIDQPVAFQDAMVASGDASEGDAAIGAGLVSMVYEPIVLCTIAVVVAFTVSAVFLPLLKLLNDLS